MAVLHLTTISGALGPKVIKLVFYLAPVVIVVGIHQRHAQVTTRALTVERGNCVARVVRCSGKIFSIIVVS